MPKLVYENWVTSKEILLKTGISRATLNNYIKAGILPKPFVKNTDGTQRKIKRIGYFPKTVFERIKIVKSLKRDGNSMSEISKTLKNVPLPDGSVCRHTDQKSIEKDKISELERPIGFNRISDEAIKVTLEDVNFPAYLVNQNFEIEWINGEAEDRIFKQNIRIIDELESRNIFKLLFSWEFHNNILNWKEIVALHLTSVKNFLPKNRISEIYEGISGSTISMLEKIYDSHTTPKEKNFLNRNYIKFVKQDESVEEYEVYTLLFREGIFFVYMPVDSDNEEIKKFLFNRQRVINELLGQRMPSMVSLCVLVANLQDSSKISTELPPSEYFELINQFWQTLRGSFEKYQGVHGKHAGDGLLYYFIKRQGSNYILDAINCALELREKMTEFSNSWKMRKKWLNDLHLNIGINEGKEFFGSIHTSVVEYTALGDTINYAGRLSDFASFGSIWTTKNLLTKLSSEELNNIHFGIRRKEHDREIFIKNTFSRVMDIFDPVIKQHAKFGGIATLPVTEIICTL